MPGGNFGLTRLIDAQLRFTRAGGVQDYAALRVKNFNDTNPIPINSMLGIPFTPTSGNPAKGYTDYRIDPPPVVRMLSMKNIADAVAAGVSLREGARDILISNTFVMQNMQARGFTDPKQVFEDVTTLGIVAVSILISIDQVMPDYAYGNAATWTIRGNANELR